MLYKLSDNKNTVMHAHKNVYYKVTQIVHKIISQNYKQPFSS